MLICQWFDGGTERLDMVPNSETIYIYMYPEAWVLASNRNRSYVPFVYVSSAEQKFAIRVEKYT